MTFPRIDNAIRTCEAHLNSSGASNSEIENFLVGYLLTVSYAEIEQAIKILFKKRAAKPKDPHLLRFVSHQIDRVTGRIKISNLSELLKMLGDDYRDVFHEKVNNQDSHLAWDNLLANRHQLSHAAGSTNMTFKEFKGVYELSLNVLRALEHSLDM